MKIKTGIIRKIIALVMTVAVVLSVAPVMSARAEESTTGTSTYSYVNDGAILHAFCWSFNTIKENLADIAAAGYTAVQTSPINLCESDYPALTLMGSNGKWYYHYQPTDWKIGNYQLGSRDEFKAMCEAAESYGIKVIVDILPNHTAVDTGDVAQDMIDAAGGADKLYHDTGLTGMSSYSDRLQCTRYASGGLPDVDTENEGFQEYFYAFLDDCIACGADGFRIDTAKHIALPDDPAPDGVENSFYPNMREEVFDKNDIFVYGEVLQGQNDRLAAYQYWIGGTTGSDYGAKIRTSLTSNDYTAAKIASYEIANEGSYVADPDKLVTWVESHDNYLNDGTWSALDEDQVALGWAIITARADGTPLFFSRPYGSSTSNQYGTNTIGIAGSDAYKAPAVAAVNKFRKAMNGEGEYLRNPGNNSQVLMIERGDKGVVIINGSHADYAVDSETNLADGTYVDKVDGTGVFTVTDGVIDGTVPARSVVVLYGAEEVEKTSVLVYNAYSWSNILASVNGSADLITGKSGGDGWYSFLVDAAADEGFSISFTNGTDVTESYTINSESGRYIVLGDSSVYASKDAGEAASGVSRVSVYFFNTECWDSVSTYSWLDDGTQLLGGWPGTAASYVGDYWWKSDIAVTEGTPFYVIFNNANGTQTDNLKVEDTSKVYFAPSLKTGLTSQAEVEEAVGISSSQTTVYFYNNSGWDSVSAYIYGGSTTFGGWPGKACEEVGNGWWKTTIEEGASMSLHVIFNNNGQGSQSPDFVISNIRDVYTTNKNDTRYASMQAAEEALGIFGSKSVLYYYDTNNWGDVYAYAYDSATGEAKSNAWPGNKMSDIENGWKTVEVSAAASDTLQVIFNDGTDANKREYTINDRTKIYLTGANYEMYTGKIAAETALGVPTSTTDVYFYNGKEWPSVSAYIYGSQGEMFGGWPGRAAVEDADGWWHIEVPALVSDGWTIIFNNSGNGEQGADVTLADQAHRFLTINDGNSYTSKNEALGIVDEPVVEPGDDPVVEPGTDPVVEPGDDPVVEPGDDPVVEPGDDPVVEPGDDP
ncbi:MAG: starch-binding protein, partial [Lachnospiraceae bacterium]|nr:starch-binding protein [Lachnospiraceae bacterium]